MPKEPPLGAEGGIFQGFVPLFALGRGSYGAVYLLQNAHGLKAVDKRVILDNLTEKEKRYAIQEIELLRQLEHPHITRYRHSFHSFPSVDNCKSRCIGFGRLQTLLSSQSSSDEFIDAVVEDKTAGLALDDEVNTSVRKNELLITLQVHSFTLRACWFAQ